MMKLEQIYRIQNKISEEDFIIVEGQKDKKALEKLGFKKIVAISGKSYDKLVDALNRMNVKRTIILTDFDREGEKKYKQLLRTFEKNGIKTDPNTRNKFKQIFKIHKIEELSSVSKLSGVYSFGNSISSSNKVFSKNRFLNRKKHKRKLKKY